MKFSAGIPLVSLRVQNSLRISNNPEHSATVYNKYYIFANFVSFILANALVAKIISLFIVHLTAYIFIKGCNVNRVKTIDIFVMCLVLSSLLQCMSIMSS